MSIPNYPVPYRPLGSHKMAALTLADIRKNLAGAAQKVRDGAGDFVGEYGKDIATGLGGAAVGGALYGLTANQRGYEDEEEFRRRRFRGVLQTAALGGALGGLAGPVKRYLGKVEGELEETNARLIEEAAAGDAEPGPIQSVISEHGRDTGELIGGAGGAAYGVRRGVQSGGRVATSNGWAGMAENPDALKRLEALKAEVSKIRANAPDAVPKTSPILGPKGESIPHSKIPFMDRVKSRVKTTVAGPPVTEAERLAQKAVNAHAQTMRGKPGRAAWGKTWRGGVGGVLGGLLGGLAGNLVGGKVENMAGPPATVGMPPIQ